MVHAVTAKRRRVPLLLAVVAAFVLPTAALAHRLDEYLQATLVDIAPGEVRLRINLTPGIDVAEQVLALIDRDRDGNVSPAEGAAYAGVLKRDLTFRIDQRIVELKLAAFNCPAPADLRAGAGIIQAEFSASPGPFTGGAHRLTLENRHLPAVSAYLFNAARPGSGSIEVVRQNRNENQSAGEIGFTVHAPANASRALRMIACLAALLAAVFAPAWRARKHAPRLT
jgi:hypothetical protein